MALGQLAGATTAQAAPSVGTNVNVSRDGANRGEAAVAVDPTNPQRVFVSATTGLYRYSNDGGATWNTPATTFTTDGGDTNSSWDTFGNLFLVYLDTGVFANPKNGHVLVWLSTDGGNNFTQIATLGTGVSAGNIDQPSVTTGAGEVWVCWRGADGKIQAAGANVTGSGSGNVGAFTAPEEAGGGNFGDIAIGPTGAVMVTYQRGNTPASIYAATDSDGTGAGGFGSEVKVTDSSVGDFYAIPPQNSRTVDAESNLAWDRSGGSHNGRVYLVYTDTPSAGSVDTNIFVRRSDDNGATWSGPALVNDDGGTNSQFLPAIALDQTTGKLAVTWYDARNDTGTGGAGDTNSGSPNDDAQYWGATSDDGTSFSANFQISAGTSNAADAASGIDYGDYSKAVYQEGTIYPVWSDNSNSTGDNPAGTLSRFDIYFAAVAVSKRATALTYNGDTSVDYNDPATLKATLKDSKTNTGVNGQTLLFTLGSQSCSGTTNASGDASCTLTPTQDPAPYTLTVSYAGTAQYSSSTKSASFTIKQEESQIAYTGGTTSHYHDTITASATLTDPDGGAPIALKLVTFTLGVGDTCSGTTDSAGNVSCLITTHQTGTKNIVASFAGDADYKSSSVTQSVSISPEETTMMFIGPKVILAGAGGATLTAKLVEDGGNDSEGDGGSPGPVPAESVTLSLGTQYCTGTTTASGDVSCVIPSVTVPLGPETVGAAFGGDAYYQASSDSTTAIVFAFPSRGAFVLGDVTAGTAGGSTVTWWADTWSQLNTVSLTPAPPPSFKGFAGVITLPTTTPPGACGSAWTTTGGNSPPPVSGIPSYMGVVVASSVSKSGSTISGNSVSIVVVKTDPGYAPTPDHPGTGTIVATFC